MLEKYRDKYKTAKQRGVTYYYNTVNLSGETYQAIYGCDGGKTAHFPAEIGGIPVRELCTGEDFLGQGFACKKAILPNGIKSVRQQAFWNNPHLEEVELPPDIENLGWQCFGFCRSLKRIHIPMRHLIKYVVAFKGTPNVEQFHVIGTKKPFNTKQYMSLIAYYYSIMKRSKRGDQNFDADDKTALELCTQFGWFDYISEYSDDFDTLFRNV